MSFYLKIYPSKQNLKRDVIMLYVYTKQQGFVCSSQKLKPDANLIEWHTTWEWTNHYDPYENVQTIDLKGDVIECLGVLTKICTRRVSKTLDTVLK